VCATLKAFFATTSLLTRTSSTTMGRGNNLMKTAFILNVVSGLLFFIASVCVDMRDC
jgi:hypothetical protein